MIYSRIISSNWNSKTKKRNEKHISQRDYIKSLAFSDSLALRLRKGERKKQILTVMQKVEVHSQAMEFPLARGKKKQAKSSAIKCPFETNQKADVLFQGISMAV